MILSFTVLNHFSLLLKSVRFCRFTVIFSRNGLLLRVLEYKDTKSSNEAFEQTSADFFC